LNKAVDLASRAEVGGDVTLDKGAVLAIVVGGAGSGGPSLPMAGGGGSFVWETSTVIPEPSTWALMLPGFAGLGFAAPRPFGAVRRAPTISVHGSPT
jgi:hypothetical protein